MIVVFVCLFFRLICSRLWVIPDTLSSGWSCLSGSCSQLLSSFSSSGSGSQTKTGWEANFILHSNVFGLQDIVFFFNLLSHAPPLRVAQCSPATSSPRGPTSSTTRGATTATTTWRGASCPRTSRPGEKKIPPSPPRRKRGHGPHVTPSIKNLVRPVWPLTAMSGGARAAASALPWEGTTATSSLPLRRSSATTDQRPRSLAHSHWPVAFLFSPTSLPPYLHVCTVSHRHNNYGRTNVSLTLKVHCWVTGFAHRFFFFFWTTLGTFCNVVYIGSWNIFFLTFCNRHCIVILWTLSALFHTDVYMKKKIKKKSCMLIQWWWVILNTFFI